MAFPLSLWDSCLACGLVAVGAAQQESVRLGRAPLTGPLLVLIGSVFVPGPLLLAALLLTSLMYHREKHAVKTVEVQWAVAGRLVGTVLGAALLRSIPHRTIFPCFLA